MANFETPNFVVSLDPSHGAIVKLRDRKTGREWASPEHPLALFSYQTFTSADFARFNAQYNTQSFAYNDFGKPGMDKFPVESRTWQPALQHCFGGEDAKGHRIIADLKMPQPDPPLKDFVSWPEQMVVEYLFPPMNVACTSPCSASASGRTAWQRRCGFPSRLMRLTAMDGNLKK